MTGTFINLTAIIVGCLLGIFFGARLSDNLKNTVVAGMGLFTTVIGFQMSLKTENPLIVLGVLIVGGLLGEWSQIENRIQLMGIWLEKRVTGGSEGSSSRFVRGFLSTSMLFCTGPMAVLDSISDGLRGDYLTLSINYNSAQFIGIFLPPLLHKIQIWTMLILVNDTLSELKGGQT
jgi:hypothetical protein